MVHNLSGKSVRWKPKGDLLPKEATVLLTTQTQASLKDGHVNLPAYSTVVLR